MAITAATGGQACHPTSPSTTSDGTPLNSSIGLTARPKARGCTGVQSSAPRSAWGITCRTSAGTSMVRMIGASRSRGRLRPSSGRPAPPAVSTCIDMRPTRRCRGDSRSETVWMRALGRVIVTRVSKPYSARRPSPTRARRKSYSAAHAQSIDSARTTTSRPANPPAMTPICQSGGS